MDLDQINPQLTVASHRIPYLLVGNDRQQWFQGKPLAEVLEYLNTRHAVANNVREDHRMTLQDLRGVYGTAKVISGGGQPGGPPCAIQPGTVYVDEAGMWSLLIRSNKPEAAGIQDFFFFFFFLGGMDIHYTSATITTSKKHDVHCKPAA